jgi:alkylation response protein AidB-like acyl-CoA dehydrogenase
MAELTVTEVAQHNSETDAWVIVNDGVYNVTKFIALHPGGRAILLEWAGKDATDIFKLYHNEDIVLRKYERLRIGTVRDKKSARRPDRRMLPNSFGDLIPYGDPAWYQRFNSPYYKETHVLFRQTVREFVEREILPFAADWADLDRPPHEVYKRMGAMGLLACMHGPPFPNQYLPSSIVPPKEFDYFHEAILFDEIARCGLSGVNAALTNGPAIGMSAIMRFGSEEMKRRVSPEVFLGEKHIALAISEPGAGSDVARIRTTARKHEDHYIVNGTKKWITNGTYAHYFVVAVRMYQPSEPHQPPAHDGMSFLLIERGTPGFSTRKLDIRGSNVSGTAFLEFDNAKVPAKNLIGKENHGFKYVMHNFNHERFYISVVATRMARICIEECIKYAMKRETFGKRLSEHAVIRAKIAAMVRAVEMQHAWLETITIQMCSMTHDEANRKLGDVICLLKSQTSKTLELCARESVHVFGGNSMHHNGVGARIEPMLASVKGYAIPAGAEDIMDDYASRTAFKLAAAMAKL